MRKPIPVALPELKIFSVLGLPIADAAIPTSNRLATFDIAVVEVALMDAETISPTTESVAYGELVPIPTLPPAVMRKSELVAEPELFVVVEISNNAWSEPYAPWRESLANAVEVPSARLLVVLSKKSLVLSPANAVPFAN